MTLRASGLALLAALAAWPGGVAAQSTRYALVLHAEADSAVVLPALQRWGVTVTLRYRTAWQATAPSPWMQQGEGESFLVLDSLHAMVSDSGPLLYAEYDRTATSTALGWDDADNATRTWGVAFVRAPDVWARGIDGAGVAVGIMDSGIDCTHPLLPHVAGGYSFVSPPGVDPESCDAWHDTNPLCKGHGTHVAGTVGGADGYGVAPGARLYALRIFADSGACVAWTSAQMAAIRWAVDHDIRVVNASIGGGASGAVRLVVQQAAASGTYLVAAAGNTASRVDYPGAYPEAIGVAAVSQSGARASYSGQGDPVDIAAPGSSVLSASPGGGTATKSGTSMATPHVAGVVALMLERRPDLSLTDVLSVLAATATDRGVSGRDPQYGNGTVDARAVDDYLLAHPVIPRPAIALDRTAVTLSRSAPAVFGVVSDTVRVTATVDTWQPTSATPGTTVTALPGAVSVGVLPALLSPALTQFPVTLDWPR